MTRTLVALSIAAALWMPQPSVASPADTASLHQRHVGGSVVQPQPDALGAEGVLILPRLDLGVRLVKKTHPEHVGLVIDAAT